MGIWDETLSSDIAGKKLKMRLMNTRKASAFLAVAALTLGTAACVTNPETGNKRISRTAIGGIGGAVGGYFLGDIIGGRRDRTEKILGAGIGAVAGAGAGYYLDEQERKLRQQTRGSGVEITRQDDSLILNAPSQVTFDVSSAAINPGFRGTLDQIARTLSEYPSSYIDVYGHTDSTGSDDFNQTLSERRARSVADYLEMRNIEPARLATRGFGESQPIETNATETGRSANRRVEIRIVPVTQNDVRQ